MNWVQDHWLQLTFIGGYLLILVGGWAIALSFYATFMSTNTFIGAAGKSWDVGLIWCLGGVVYVACRCASWFLVAPRFVPRTREYGSLTVADFLGYRYGSLALRRTAAVIVLFSSVIYLVAIYRGSALALQELLSLPHLWAMIAIFVVVTAYTVAGGFESVVLTDALQGSLMVVGAGGMAAAVIWQGGGLVAILDELHRQDSGLVSWQGHMPLGTIMALSLAVGIKFLVDPRQLPRFYGLKDRASLRRASLVAPLVIVVTYVCLLPIGALAHALLPKQAITSSDQVVPYLLSSSNLFGPVIGSLFLLVLLSAAMSSIDSVLLVAASTIDHDLIAPGTTDRNAVRRTRIWVIVVSLASMLVAVSPITRDIMTVTALSGSLYGACFLPALVLSLFWRRTSATAALASVVCGAVAVVAWFIARQAGWTELHEVYPGLVVGLSVYVALGMMRPEKTTLSG